MTGRYKAGKELPNAGQHCSSFPVFQHFQYATDYAHILKLDIDDLACLISISRTNIVNVLDQLFQVLHSHDKYQSDGVMPQIL